MNVFESLPDLSGIEQLRVLMGNGRRAPIADALDFSLVAIEEGKAVIAGAPSLKVYNGIGSIHGGYAATLLDSACGCAVHSRLAPNQGYSTLELKVSYLRALTLDIGTVKAEGTVLSMGRRVAFVQATLCDQSGVLYALASSTLLLFERRVAEASAG